MNEDNREKLSLNHTDAAVGFTRPQASGLIHYNPDALIKTKDPEERSIIIKQAMLAAGVTQLDIARQAGVTRPQVSLLVNNPIVLRSRNVEQYITAATGLIFPPLKRNCKPLKRKGA
jgi:hypothetical protein